MKTAFPIQNSPRESWTPEPVHDRLPERKQKTDHENVDILSVSAFGLAG